MNEPTTWRYQDVLKLSVNQWCEFLKNQEFFDDRALRMVRFVYQQPNHTSTASDIAAAFRTDEDKVHHNAITACNRKVARRLYKHFDVEPPIDTDKGKRYWNVVFDGNPEQPKDENKHYYWILRPRLAEAIELLALIK